MDDALLTWLGISGTPRCLDGLMPGIWPATALYLANHVSPTPPEYTPSEITQAFDGIRGLSPSRVRITVPLAAAGSEVVFQPFLSKLCRESWDFVGAWKHSCSYRYSVPYAKTLQELQKDPAPKPFVVRTTVTSSLSGLRTEHQELVSSLSLPFGVVQQPAHQHIQYSSVSRRPWSTKEDSANTLSDVFLSYIGISQLGRPAQTSTAIPIDLTTIRETKDTLAAKGMPNSEHWINHEAAMTDALDDASGIAADSVPIAILEVEHATPVTSSVLPQVCDPLSVTLAFEKTLTSAAGGGGVDLVDEHSQAVLSQHAPHVISLPVEWKVTLSTASTGSCYSQAERDLHAALDQHHPLRPGSATQSSIHIEIVNAHQLVKQGANPLWLAVRLWLAAMYFREENTPIAVIKGSGGSECSGGAETAWHAGILGGPRTDRFCQLWRAAFLCRAWRSVNQQTLSQRWRAALTSTCGLSRGQYFTVHSDILKHWGALLTAEPDMSLYTYREEHERFNISGTMPRQFERAPGNGYVQRPTILQIRNPVLWSWDVVYST